MVLPVAGPATLAGVAAELSLTSVPSSPSLRFTQLTEVVAAVNSLVRAMPVAQLADGLPDWTGAERVTLGANRLAARLDQRRNTPLGYEAFGEGGPVYVSRNDPDIAQLLALGRYAPPMVG